MSEQQPSPPAAPAPNPIEIVLRDGVGTSSSIADLAGALAAAQAGFSPVSRDREVEVRMKSGGTYKFKYATLENVVSATRPALAANGLAIVQLTARVAGQDGIVSLMTHSSGQWVGSLTTLGSGNDPQAIGGLYSYARRYAWSAMCGVAAEEDTDGPPHRGEASRNSRPTGARPRSSGRRPDPAPKTERPKPAARRRTTGDPAGKVDTRAAYWRGFQVDLKPLARPPAHSAYDVLKGWLASRGKPKPSEMTCAGLDTLWGWLLDEGLQRVGAWADTPEGRKVLEGPAGEVVGGGA